MKVVSFKGTNINDGTNYVAGLLPQVRGLPRLTANMVGRTGHWPLLGGVTRPGRELTLEIILLGDLASQQAALSALFDPEDETPGQLIVDDEGGGNQRYVMVLCKALEEDPRSGGTVFVASLQVDGDVRYNGVTEQDHVRSWGAGSPSSVAVSNGGEDVALPVIRIKPVAAKTGDSFLYRRWVPIRWRVSSVGFDYPIELTDGGWDTAALVTAGKMQASGNDLRVFVDGVEAADRQVNGINTASTQVWTALNFVERQEVTLAVAIASAGAVDRIDAEESINGFPAQGIVMIDNEAFVYTSKNNSLKRFLGVSRAQRNTSMAAHSIGATVWWVQRDVFIKYGNPTAGAAPEDNALKSGMMTSASDNDTWVWDDVKAGDGEYNEVAAWRYVDITAFNAMYTGYQGAMAAGPDWQAAGIEVSDQGVAMWYMFNPCGFSNVAFDSTNERMAVIPAHWDGRIVVSGAAIGLFNGSGGWYFSIPAPTVASTWQTWSTSQALPTDISRSYVALWLKDTAGTGDSLYLDGWGVITLDIIAANRPTLAMGAEAGIYELDARLTNHTTGEVLLINFDMEIDETLEIDTVNKRVTYLADGSNQYQALEVVGLRRYWWPLRAGVSSYSLTDTGAAAGGVEVTLLWRERSYG